MRDLTHRPWLKTGLVVLLLVAGAAVGGAVVATTGIAAGTRVEVVPSPSPGPVSPSPNPSSSPALVEVQPGCLRSLDAARSIYGDLQQLGAAASSLDLGAVDRLLRRVQSMRGALEQNLTQCHATVHLPGTPLAPSPAGSDHG